MRFFLEVAYKGTKYHGWQIQQNARSVQEEINLNLTKLFGPVTTMGSGRTDTGVHAEQQFLQLDLEVAFTQEHLSKLNTMLPKDIAIKNYFPVTPGASARHDPLHRTYEYRICKFKNPFMSELAYLYSRPLDMDAMNEAAALLLLHTDFQSFSKVKTSVDHFLCDLQVAKWEARDEFLVFTITGNRFLRGMVRAIVGTLIKVGLGKITPEDFDLIIAAKDRKAAGQAAPPQGLFLTSIVYPSNIFLEPQVK
ncbi:MAG TPA: tRNA pseudouridine(38-40) synthase TruA [Cytophagaceae bacterium]|jgi:tRNA pseudouridine38-40 synthase